MVLASSVLPVRWFVWKNDIHYVKAENIVAECALIFNELNHGEKFSYAAPMNHKVPKIVLSNL